MPNMSDRKIFQDSVVPIPQQPGLTPSGMLVAAADPQHGEETMDIHFSLSLPDGAQQQLEQRVAKGDVLTPEELDKLYTAKPADVNALKEWLKNEGFTITESTPDGIYARAKVKQIAHSLEVNMGRVTKEGVTYNAAFNAPSLPSNVAGVVQSINGLQPYRQAHKHLRRVVPQTAIARRAVQPNRHPISRTHRHISRRKF